MEERVAALWGDLAAPLRAYFARHARRGADPDDLVQECFLRVVSGIDTAPDDARLGAWVQGIARHLALDTHRGAPAPVTVPEEPAAAEEDAEDFDDLVGGWIRARIETLPEPHGEALRLFELERLPQAEIAAQLGVSAGTVKTRIHRGRAAVRDDLLACCDIELDAGGHVIDWRRRQSPGCDDCG
ncbi:MAG: sigma-70 family RNA polymerase sigma factor [Planctomycetota bacterium]